MNIRHLVDDRYLSVTGWYEVDDYFPGRARWRRWLKLLNPFRRPSQAYDAAYYDAPGGTYGGYRFDGRYAAAAKKIVDDFMLQPGAEILEVGCAKGFLLVELQRLGMRVTGLEASEYAALEAHPEVEPHIHLWRGQSLPYSAQEFDLVLCKEALPHMANPALMIEQIERVGQQSLLVIQVAETALQAWAMKRWDPTHQHLKPSAWWKTVLAETGFSGAVTFKQLF